MPRAGLSYRGKALLRTTSQSRFTRQGRVAAPSIRRAPLASCWPRPQQLLPVSAAGGGRRRCPQRGSHWHVGQASLRTTSQSASLDKAGLRLPASAALRLRLAGRCPNSSSLFPPLAAVVAVAPGRGASGETVHFAGPCRRGYFSNLFREFVENARVKREEFVNVIKMRRRY